MSTQDEKKTSVFDKFSIKVGYIALLCLVVFAIWKLGNVWIERVVNTQQQQVSQTIINTVNEQAKLDLMMPDIVFINIDSGHMKQLNDTIAKQISTFLTKKYLNNQEGNPSDINFQPYFVFPDSADSKGNYKLTKIQLDELKANIQFLTSQVDKAVTATKEEINKEIDRINTWVSIWIGMLSIFGTIIPLFYNYKNNEDLKKIKEDADKAHTNAEEAKKLAEGVNTEIEKVKGLPEELKKVKDSFDGFEENVKQAKKDSGEAITKAKTAIEKADKLEGIVIALNDISKIKDIDGSFLLYNKKPFESLKILLADIHISLNNNQELHSNSMVIDVFRQLAKNIRLIAFYDFVKPANFDLLHQFAFALSNIISQPITQESYNNALALLNTLNNDLTTD